VSSCSLRISSATPEEIDPLVVEAFAISETPEISTNCFLMSASLVSSVPGISLTFIQPGGVAPARYSMTVPGAMPVSSSSSLTSAPCSATRLPAVMRAVCSLMRLLMAL